VQSATADLLVNENQKASLSGLSGACVLATVRGPAITLMRSWVIHTFSVRLRFVAYTGVRRIPPCNSSTRQLAADVIFGVAARRIACTELAAICSDFDYASPVAAKPRHVSSPADRWYKCLLPDTGNNLAVSRTSGASFHYRPQIDRNRTSQDGTV